MRVFESDYSLHEIEMLLEEKMEEGFQNMQEEEGAIIESFDLSYEDYCYLLLKLKGLMAYGRTVELFQKYKISVVTMLVYAIRYDKKETVYEKIKLFVKKMPQHQLRYVMDIFESVAEEYGMYHYKKCEGSLQHLFETLVIQAGGDCTYYISNAG